MSSQNFGFSRDAAGTAIFGGTRLSELLSEADQLDGKGPNTVRGPHDRLTPAYFYDLTAIAARVEKITQAFAGAPHLIAYAIKANSAGSVVKTITGAGAGIDAVSIGELLLARRLGVPGHKIVLSGVAKRDDELDRAIEEDILAIQAESLTELARIHDRAKARGRTVRVSLRLNPSVTIDSHSHIATGHDKAKFGIHQADLQAAYTLLKDHSFHLRLVGVSTHVGSMLKEPTPYLKSARVVCRAAKDAQSAGFPLEYVDFGGGFGIDYGDGPTEAPPRFAEAALGLLKEQGLSDLMLVIEPGRSLVGSFGVLVASVVQEKRSGTRRWLMLDAGMNDLLRPALYQAHHRIEALDQAPGSDAARVVGPVCESTDDFGDHHITGCPSHVVIRDAGAYGFVMASQYNARTLPTEVFVQDGHVVHVSRSPGLEAWLGSRAGA